MFGRFDRDVGVERLLHEPGVTVAPTEKGIYKRPAAAQTDRHAEPRVQRTLVLTDAMQTRWGALALLSSAACAGSTEARPPEAPRPLAAIEMDAGAIEAGPTEVPGTVHLWVTEANGVPPALVAQAYQAAREPLQSCQQSGGGKVNVRITRQEGRFHLSVEPGASLDPSARHCVLEALSTVELEDTAGNVGGPAIKPSGFTSLITVSW